MPDAGLSVDFHGDGHLSGSTGCNSLFGDYQVAGTSIDIGPLGMTRMACANDGLADQEARYLAALDGATSWTLDGQDLVLLGPDGATLMTLVTQPDVIPVPTPSPTPEPTPKPTPKPTAETVVVPDVVGDPEADALVALGAAGLKAGEKTSKYDSDKKGTVIGTDPKAGVVVQRGTRGGLPDLQGPVAVAVADREADREAHPQADREAHPQADREADPQADREAHPQADREAHPQADREAHPQADNDPLGPPEPDQLDPVPLRRRVGRCHRRPGPGRDADRCVRVRHHQRFRGLQHVHGGVHPERVIVDQLRQPNDDRDGLRRAGDCRRGDLSSRRWRR